jgi:hypothetical protein
MQYIRRRIQRVSGVTIRDERIESRDFSVQPQRENWGKNWDELGTQARDRANTNREARVFNRQGINYRERT